MDQPLIISTLSAEYIYGLIAVRAEKRALYERLPRELDELDKRIGAALMFAPADFDPNKPQSMTVESDAAPSPMPSALEVVKLQARKEPVKRAEFGWKKALLIVLSDAGKGLTHKEVIAAVRQRYPMPPTRSGEEKSFYNALSKALIAGEVVKHGNVLYAAHAYREAKEAGTLPEAAINGRRAGSSSELIARLLREHPEGLTGTQMRELFQDIPDAPKSLIEHGQYVYNILAPMIGIGEVVRNADGVYRLSAGVGK